MNIKDPAHAVRVLEALVEQGAKIDLEFYPSTAESMQDALVEGAKAVLEMWYMWKRPDTSCDYWVIALAQAYAPRMLEAGMEVPE